ncbi:MAG: hypothetical protein AB7P99_14415 [Vicinamibacterales bacterium]
MDVTPVLIVGVVFITTAWVISIFVEAFRHRAQVRAAAEFQGKLLDKIGSTQEFGEFLNSAGGAQFLDSMRVKTEAGPHARVLRALQSGIVLSLLGAGLFVLMAVRQLPFDAEDGMAVFATLALSTGIGLLIASGATMVLSRRMGLMNGQPHARSHASDIG